MISLKNLMKSWLLEVDQPCNFTICYLDLISYQQKWHGNAIIGTFLERCTCRLFVLSALVRLDIKHCSFESRDVSSFMMGGITLVFIDYWTSLSEDFVWLIDWTFLNIEIDWDMTIYSKLKNILLMIIFFYFQVWLTSSS